MQSWSLERKIQVTQTRIIEWYEHYNGLVYVSFSGGKDSTVLLDLARRIYPDIPAVFVDTGLEFPEIRKFVSTFDNVEVLHPKMPFPEVIKKWGYPVIGKEVASCIYYAKQGKQWALNRLQGLNDDGTPSVYKARRYIRWKHLVDAPFLIGEGCCRVMKKQPAKKYERKTKRKGILGQMASESGLRTTEWLKTGCNSFDGYRPMSKPMSFWTEQDVLAYLDITKIPYCSVYGDIVCENGVYRVTGEPRTGCMYCLFGAHLDAEPNRFQKMAIQYPKIYDFCINRMGFGEVMDYLKIPYKPSAELAEQLTIREEES